MNKRDQAVRFQDPGAQGPSFGNSSESIGKIVCVIHRLYELFGVPHATEVCASLSPWEWRCPLAFTGTTVGSSCTPTPVSVSMPHVASEHGCSLEPDPTGLNCQGNPRESILYPYHMEEVLGLSRAVLHCPQSSLRPFRYPVSVQVPFPH